MAEENEKTDVAASRARAREGRSDRCSSAVAAKRTDTVLHLMASGQWNTAQAQRLAREWGVALRTVQDYSRIAGKILHPGNREDIEELRADTIVKLGLLHDDAKTVGEFRSAVAALAERAKVAGLVGSGVTINNTVINSLTVEQLRSSPAWRAGLEELSTEWRAMAETVARLELGEASPGELAAAWRALDRAAYGERGDVVEALPVASAEEEL